MIASRRSATWFIRLCSPVVDSQQRRWHYLEMSYSIYSIEGNRQRLDGGAMFGNVPRALWSKWAPADEQHRISLACRAFLIHDQASGRRILLEAGIGVFFEPKLMDRFGVLEPAHQLLVNLAALNLSPEQIDVVVLSHLHFDHAGGLLTAWRPDGRYIAATCNQFLGHFPANARLYYFEAVEKRGDLLVYDVEKNSLHTTKAVFEHEYIETHPCWSHDGKYIYYSRGKDTALTRPEDFAKFRFDMARIACNPETDTWGSPEIVKAYSKLGKSCAFPRPSPCGKYVLHILADKTTYPIHQKSADVYLLGLESKEHRRLDAVCSDLAESYPRWSSNGRWFVFLSNRRDGISALPYFAYFDASGQAHKAFVLPQEDPAYYDTFLDTYNVVELVKSRVDVNTFKLAQGMQQPAIGAQFPNAPQVDAYTGATKLVPHEGGGRGPSPGWTH